MTLVRDVSMEYIGARKSRPLEREASMSTIRSESPPPTTPSTPTCRTRQLEAPSPPSDTPDVAYMVATPTTPSPRASESGDIEHMLYTFTYRNSAGDVVVVDPMSLDGHIKFKGALLHVSSIATGSPCANMQPARDIFVLAPTRSAITCTGFLNAFLIALGLGLALYELTYQTDLWRAFLLRGRF